MSSHRVLIVLLLWILVIIKFVMLLRDVLIYSNMNAYFI